MLREVLQGAGERNSGAADNGFTATVDPLEGREVEFAKEVTALLEVASKFSEQKVGCKRDFNGLSNSGQTNISSRNTIHHKPFLQSNEGIAVGLRGWQMRGRAAARHHTRVE